VSSPTPKPRGELSSRTLEAHLQWVRRGRTGDGRLDIANVSVKGLKVGAKDMSGAKLDGVIFDRADVSFSTFEGAELTGVTMIQTHAGNCRFNEARLVTCDLLGANVAIGKFEDAMIVGGRFERTFLDRSSFRRAKVGGASFRDAVFGNTVFDGALFTDCDLRGASFSLRTRRVLGTTDKTVFERCDLRNTGWNERDLENAVFIDCKLHGLRGRPSRTVGVVIERPDLSPDGDGSALGRDVDVLATWMGAT
jgi:fluoroquinolone resistance protein